MILYITGPDSGPLMDPLLSSSYFFLFFSYLEGWQWNYFSLLVHHCQGSFRHLPGGDLGDLCPFGPSDLEALFPALFSSSELAYLCQDPPFPG